MLKAQGAQRIFACATHAVLSGLDIERIINSPIEKLIVTNSIPHEKSELPDKIVQLSVAQLLGEAISRIHDDSSVSEMFE